MIADSRDLSHCVKGGIVAGIVGGVVIAIFMLVANLITGQDVWMGMKFAGAPFLGERAMQPGLDPIAVLVGVLSHLAVSVAWGIPFGLLAFGLARSTTVLAGALWGIVVWVGMFYVLLPILGLGRAARSAPVVMAILQHVLFGVAVGLGFLPYQRPVIRRYASAR